MNKIHIANLLLTRRCNLSCEYCHLIRDYDNMPKCYHKINHFANNEMYAMQWIEIIKKLVANNPDIFLILYGGEPFLYDGLRDIVKYCNDENVGYTVISNNTPIARARAYEIVADIGPFHGFTSSVDPVALMPESELTNETKEFKHIVKKSKFGLTNLAQMKIDGISKDVVAEITVTNRSLPYLYDTIVQLTKNDVWSSITVIDDKKSPYYDFAADVDKSQMLTREECEEIFVKITSEAQTGVLKVHIPELLPEILNVLPSNMKCTLRNDIHNITIDPDGSMRLCLRIRGERCPLIHANIAISKTGDVTKSLKKAIKRDYDNFCLGCNWTCPMMSGTFSESIIDH